MATMNEYIIIYICLLAVYGFTEIFITRKSKAGPGSSSRDLTFYAVTIPSMGAFYGPIVEQVMWQPDVSKRLFVFGVFIFLVAVVIRLKGLHDLGRGFSVIVEKQQDHQLVTSGIYTKIRHPLYLANSIMVAVAPFMLASHYSWGFTLLAYIGIGLRISKEERFMLANFPEYRNYMKHSWRMFPGIF